MSLTGIAAPWACVAAVLALGTVAALFWAVRSGQFEDLEGPAHRILLDEDAPASPPRGDEDAPASPSRGDEDAPASPLRGRNGEVLGSPAVSKASPSSRPSEEDPS